MKNNREHTLLLVGTSLALFDVEPLFLSDLLPLLVALPFELTPELDAPRSTSHIRGYGTRPVRACNSNRRNEKSGKM